MRPIKFRAYNKDWGMMVPSEEIYTLEFNEFNDSELLEIGFNITTTDGVRNNNVWDVTDDVVLMQFTGLLDRKGEEIYEGDIVTNHEMHTEKIGEKNYEVVFLDTQAAFGIKYLVGGVEYGSPIGAELSKMEVIGNIYENANLLEKI